MASAILRDLEDICSKIDAGTMGHHDEHIEQWPPMLDSDHDLIKSYGIALSSAEKSVNRLGQALTDAEQEMETTMRTTVDLYKSQLAQKHLEIAELKKVVVAKEKLIDQLREALSASKRGQELKIHQLELVIAGKDKELHAMLEGSSCLRQERNNLSEQLKQEVADAQATEQHLKHRELELLTLLDQATAGNELLNQRAQQDAQEMEHVHAKCDSLQADLNSSLDKLTSVAEDLNQYKQKFWAEADLCQTIKQQAEEDARKVQQMHVAKDAQITELKNKIRAERTLRKASEQLLKSEVKAREDMERLLTVMRNVTVGNPGTEDEAASLLADMKKAVQLPSEQSGEIEQVKRCLEHDNSRLKAELTAAKRLITSKLKQRAQS